MTELLVRASGISRTFGTDDCETTAVIDASCEIFTGDRIALVGPSGSGKSTLLHILGGLDEPTSGEISWPGLGPSEQLRPRNVMDVFQGPSLLSPLTVIENVRLPLLLAGIDDREANDDATVALAAFGVGQLRDKLPEEISGGQAQRVAIARAMAGRPALLLADEPTGQLDSRTARDALRAMIELAQQTGAALVISTHDPLISEMMDIAWTMRSGHLNTRTARPGRRAGSPTAVTVGVMSHPAHAFRNET